MSDELKEIIKINKKLVAQNNKLINQNEDIIELLRKIAGEEAEQLEYVVMDSPNEEIVSDVLNQFNLPLESDSAVGEVFFIEGKNIFKLSIKNNEKSIDNLTGSAEASDFALQELVVNESISKNIEIPPSTVILNDSQSQNLSDTLKICIDNGAENVFIPWSGMTQLVWALEQLKSLINIEFYRTDEELIEKLFGE